ncbi:hypothetical protein BS50DRAFT_504604, partial [Corynespora cassiicola Philippines]
LLRQWHWRLSLPQQPSQSWHRDRFRKELRERTAATTLSEKSNNLFAISPDQHNLFPKRKLAGFLTPRNAAVHAYILAKYTLR